EEVLDLVDTEPRVGVGLCRSGLGEHDVDRHADSDQGTHFDRRRSVFFGVLVPRATDFLAAGFFFLFAGTASPLSRAQVRALLTARCQPITSSSAASLSIAGVN